MRQLTSDEYNSLDDNWLRIHHWVCYEMTPRERQRWDRAGHDERDVMAIEHFELLREERRKEGERIAAARPPQEKWFAPDTLTARIEGSMNDVDAILAALRERQQYDEPDVCPFERMTARNLIRGGGHEAIIVWRNGDGASKSERAASREESSLRTCPSVGPERLPGDEIREDLKILILARELSTRSGLIDIVAVDELGTLYFIETKFYRDRDACDLTARVLDCGTALWSHPPDFGDFLAVLSQHVQEHADATLVERIAWEFGLDEEHTSDLLRVMAECLTEGTFRLVVVSDRILDGPDDVALWLGKHGHFHAHAVRLECCLHQSYEVIKPHLLRDEAEMFVQSVRSWSVAEVLADAERRAGTDWTLAIQRILGWAKENGFPVSCGRGLPATLTVRTVIGGREVPLLQVAANGALYVYFKYLKSLPAFSGLAPRQTLLRDVTGITGANQPDHAVDRWVRVGYDRLCKPDVLGAFLTRMKAAVDAARSWDTRAPGPAVQ